MRKKLKLNNSKRVRNLHTLTSDTARQVFFIAAHHAYSLGFFFTSFLAFGVLFSVRTQTPRLFPVRKIAFGRRRGCGHACQSVSKMQSGFLKNIRMQFGVLFFVADAH